MKKPIVLRIYKSDQLIGVKQFLDSQIVVGQRGEVQIALNDSRVSLIHAAIEERETGYFICDLGSETGTFLNGAQVLDSTLESGDILQFGDHRVEFFIGVPKTKGETTESGIRKIGLHQDEVKSTELSSPPRPVTQTPALTLSGPETQRASPRKTADRLTPAKTKRGRKTFAPPSSNKSVRELVKPTKGTVVEVLVAWRERVIATYHFKYQGTITLGSKPDCDIVLPVFTSRVRKIPLIRIAQQATVLVTPDLTGELIRGQTSSSFAELLRQNRMKQEGTAYAIILDQGEMVQVQLSEQVSVVVRYVSDSPKPLIAPWFDLTNAEATGVILSVAIVALLWFYMLLYAPPKQLDDDGIEEPLRIATVKLEPPRVSPPISTEPVATPPPPPVAKATPIPLKSESKEAKGQVVANSNLTRRNDNGRAANAAPNKNKLGPRQLTSPKQGGSIKTTDRGGAQMKSRERDLSKSGIFSVFGSGGQNNAASTVTNGSGELAGAASSATGRSGYQENRAGKGLGSATKDTGRGGSGSALNGIAGGVGTAGRGSGNAGYGQGGLGSRQGVKIVTGGSDAKIGGGIDKDAIKRVIDANYRVIKNCYERELNRNPDLYGKLTIGWDIGEGGRVLAVRLKSNELGNAAVGQCIMDRLKTWKFPDPPANQVVEVESYPFVFLN